MAEFNSRATMAQRDLQDDDGPLDAYRLPRDDEGVELVAVHVLALPEHMLLRENDVQFGYVMRCDPKEKAGKTELGSVHVVKYMAQGAFKDLWMQLLEAMLGHLPEFLVVLDAGFWAKANDHQREALLFHEFSHVTQKLDAFGAPKFDRDGLPVFNVVEHDVTAFNAEVVRYGAWNSGIREFLAAAESVGAR